MLSSLLIAAVGSVAIPSPALPPHTVIAQGFVEFEGGTYAWSHTAHDLTGTGVTIDPSAAVFLLASGEGSALLTGADGSRALVGSAEAQFSPESGVTWTAIAMAESGGGAAAPAARLDAVAIVPAEPGEGTFTVDPGWHDVEMRHLALPSGASLESPGATPGFAVVAEGAVVDDVGTTVEPGGTVLVAGGATLTNTDDQPAIVLMAVIGPTIDITPDAETSIVTTIPPPPSSASPATTTTTTSSTTTTDMPIDLDGDGLSDDEEAALGTDHNDVDSDDDTLSDGDEVNTHGTDPLAIDTDGDQLPDAGEIVTYGSDPLDPDTDDDGLADIEPVNWGTGPTDPDTDDDGLNDGQEVNGYGSDPHQTDTDGDSLGDGDEVNTWGSNPTNSDSDGDTLVDGEEVNGTHTDPALADTDGDGIDDGTEAGNGTDPTDANDP